MFFTSKNSLVIILLLYRVVVVHLESHDKKKNVKSSPIVQRCQPTDGFVEYETRNGKVHLKPCHSTPDVYVCKTPESIQRYKTLRKIGKSDPQIMKRQYECPYIRPHRKNGIGQCETTVIKSKSK